MSSFTQFTGNAVPFGQLVPLWDYRNNPTINGIEYLKTGVLKSITGYSSFAADWPSLAVNTSATSYAASISGASSSVLLTDGTRYYSFPNLGAPGYGTTTTSAWTTALTGASSSSSDAYRLGTTGTRLINFSSSNIYYTDGTTSTSVATTSNMACGASNPAGTLAVACSTANGTAGEIYTSTNGSAWTSRASSGAPGNNIVAATWSPIGNCFIYLCSAAILTTTNGFTVTSRGTPTGTPAVSNQPSNLCASSASSTLMAYNISNVGYLVRTTDGINFTTSTMASLIPSDSAAVSATKITSCQYISGNYYITLSLRSGSPVTNLLKSTDEGVTWTSVTKLAYPGSATYDLSSLVSVGGNLLATWNLASNPLQYVPLSSTDTANYIGVSYGSSVVSDAVASVSYNYVRIK